MNTTMAPMDHDQDSLIHRRDSLYRLALRETASASGDNGGGDKSHGKGFGFFNRNKDKGNSNDPGGNGPGGNSNKDSNGGGTLPGAVPSVVSTFIPSVLEASATSTGSTSTISSTTSSTASSTIPSITSSTTENSATSSSIALTSGPKPSNNVISTLFPMTTADSSTAIPTLFPFTSSQAAPTALPVIASSSLDIVGGTSLSMDSSIGTETGSSSTKIKPASTGTRTGDSPFSTDRPPFFPGFHRPQSNGLSTTGEHLLIGFGAIGAFIMLCAAAYFCARMRNQDLFACLRNRKFAKGGRRGWYGWRKEATDEDYVTDHPPKYFGEEYFSDSKEPVVEVTYLPQKVSTVVPTTSAHYPIRKEGLRLDTGREGLLNNSALIGTTSSTVFAQESATDTFYGIATPLARNPNKIIIDSSPSPHDTPLTRQLSADYTNGGTYLTRQTSDAFDPNQREVNHLSYLSSLSSGFGDALIIPEPTTYRASQPTGAPRFSWQRSIVLERTASQRDRDTVYTTASTESAPRFRSVSSWVAQQSNRVDRQVQSDKELSSMPIVPLALQAGVAHRRSNSDDQAFKHHPGEEVDIKTGTRITSIVLDDTITFIRKT